MNKILEKNIELEFIEKAKNYGWITEKFEFVGKRGAPDRIIFLNYGITAFIEFKRTEKDNPSTHQISFKNKIEKLGHHWLLAYTVNQALDFCINLENDYKEKIV